MKLKDISICRVYELPEEKEGIWILVDKLWPRGIKKEELPYDEWLQEIAPSAALRKWFDHDPEKWEEFRRKYAEELHEKEELVQKLLEKAKQNPVTLLFAAKDKRHNHALVLKEALLAWPEFPDFCKD
ncbi:DUF488 domain-containing protein [Legionella londiniensis]|uniref:Uroporphyrin-III C-methyltransferase n=1 Tax=Legionella londiniensis TaxID=45068 RepID=A0A0W0VR67_9GAMM|nr:DUF488 family protein [Legionella londiniensis]KTD22579.1 uroporphyrin-III C- methyltransferase [Legionella londiniensis]STX92510.1 uroporphyrin-III C-methyltransferase [Legionella londiniensis]